MNKRIQQFLAAENISQSQFAETIGVARASVSHVLAGRNKPSFDFIERMCKHYPSLNLEWLISGKGRMFKSPIATNSEASGLEYEAAAGIFTPAQDDIIARDDDEYSAQIPVPPVVEGATEAERKASAEKLHLSTSQRKIRKLIIFFDDGTFQEMS